MRRLRATDKSAGETERFAIGQRVAHRLTVQINLAPQVNAAWEELCPGKILSDPARLTRTKKLFLLNQEQCEDIIAAKR